MMKLDKEPRHQYHNLLDDDHASDDCRKRWKNIRDSYQRIKRKNKLPSKSVAGRKSKKWPLLEKLCFLENIPIERKTKCYIETSDDNDSEDDVSNDDKNSIKSTTSEEYSTTKEISGSPCRTSEESIVKANENNRSETNSEGTSGTEMVNAGTSEIKVIIGEVMADYDETQNKNAKRSTRGVLKKKKQSENIAKQLALFKYWKERDTERRTQEQESDVDGLKSFCSHVGTMLGKLTPALRVEAKTKVFNILAEYELMSLRQSSCNSSNNPPV